MSSTRIIEDTTVIIGTILLLPIAIFLAVAVVWCVILGSPVIVLVGLSLLGISRWMKNSYKPISQPKVYLGKVVSVVVPKVVAITISIIASILSVLAVIGMCIWLLCSLPLGMSIIVILAFIGYSTGKTLKERSVQQPKP